MSSKTKTRSKRRNGEGTVYKVQKTGKWVAQLKINGRRTTVATEDTEEEAIAKLDKAKVEVRERTYIERDGKTIGTILEENLRHKERLNKVRQSTILRDKNSATVILNDPISKVPIQKATRHDIQNFLDEKAQIYSNSYIDKIYTHLANVYKSATLDHLISENLFVMGAIDKPTSVRPDKEVKALTREEQARFVAKLKDPNYHDEYKDIFFFLIETGMRVGEVLALERTDIDMKNNIIHITKTISRDKHDRPVVTQGTKTKSGIRDIPLNEHLKQIVKKNMNLKLLFTLPDGRPISTSTINSHCKKIYKDCNISRTYWERKRKDGSVVRESTSSYTTHCLRHTFITRCVENGMPPKVLQTLVGHSDYRITADIYTQIDDKYASNELQKVEEQLKASNLI